MNKFLLPGIFTLLAVNLGVSGYSLTRCCRGCPATSTDAVVLPSPSVVPSSTVSLPTPTQEAVATPSISPAPDEKLLIEVNNIAACGYTDKAEFSLTEDHFITRLRTWYSWGANETEVGYKLTRNGSDVYSGKLTRKDCDPYQRQWCIAADYDFNRQLPAGDYVLQAEKSQICQNSQSQRKGFIYVWGR